MYKRKSPSSVNLLKRKNPPKNPTTTTKAEEIVTQFICTGGCDNYAHFIGFIDLEEFITFTETVAGR